MFNGIRRFETQVDLKSSATYRWPEYDVAVFYGLAGGLRKVLEDYRAKGKKAVYIDLGYWNRRSRTRWDGFHKISVNDRHPTAYFQSTDQPMDRLRAQNIRIESWRENRSAIVVAGMSAKAATASGFVPHAWERATIADLRKHTDRPIIYRPKPNWLGALPIAGSTMMKTESLPSILGQAYCVVAHHSNVAVDALLAGIPCVCDEGVASVLATPIDQIDAPIYPDGREQWAANVAYCQWSLDEMRKGAPWSHLLRHGLV